MTDDHDLSYFIGRAAQERRMADHADSSTVQALHLQLAETYERRAGLGHGERAAGEAG